VHGLQQLLFVISVCSKTKKGYQFGSLFYLFKMMKTHSNYTLVSGYYDTILPCGLSSAEWFPLWRANTELYCSPKYVYLISSSKNTPKIDDYRYFVIEAENLGHTKDIPMSQKICGGMACLLIGCMMAYHNKTDLIYKESDCLCFGNWIDTLYREIGDNGVITGHLNFSVVPDLIGTSLFLIKQNYLLEFVRDYLSIPQTDKEILPEYKIKGMKSIAFTSMDYDRSRPFSTDHDAWYIQQLNAIELAYLREKNLI
jgi:hypothetical protein